MSNSIINKEEAKVCIFARLFILVDSCVLSLLCYQNPDN